MKEHTQLLEAYFRGIRDVRLSGAGVREKSYAPGWTVDIDPVALT